MKLVEHYPKPTAGGARCYLCAGINARPLVQTGVSIDFEGHLVICAKCVRRMAGMLGWIDEEKAEKLRQANRHLGAENARLTKRLLALDTFRAAAEKLTAEVAE